MLTIMEKMLVKVETQHAPPVLGAYSQGVLVNVPSRLLFVSGQLPICPHNGKIVEGDIRVKTKRAIDNLAAILTSGGSSLDLVVRVEIFMTHLATDFPAMNLEYLLRFNQEVPPVRQTIGVLELPMGSPLEISCVALVP
jgi:2-iminobutanoate/2-iminopropanoate deaminase